MSAHEPHGNVEVVADPIADPGLSPHLPRPTDVDPAKEKRAERQVATLTEAQRQQALAHAEAMQTVKQSLDNNTRTLRMLNDSMNDLRENMSDLRETVHELYGFIRSVVKRDGGDEKEK